ncbi:hypothetical protein KM043_005384 [Ampulex compressa]|nr:hypothetical protein KM043_005384 [Ampulex compressa]
MQFRESFPERAPGIEFPSGTMPPALGGNYSSTKTVRRHLISCVAQRGSKALDVEVARLSSPFLPRLGPLRERKRAAKFGTTRRVKIRGQFLLGDPLGDVLMARINYHRRGAKPNRSHWRFFLKPPIYPGTWKDNRDIEEVSIPILVGKAELFILTLNGPEVFQNQGKTELVCE